MLAMVFAAVIAGGAASNGEGTMCHAGAYRLADHTYLDVTPGDSDKLRWRMFDGRSGLLTRNRDGSWASTLGWSGVADGITVQFGSCSERRIDFGGHAGRKLTFDIVETKFRSAGEILRGRLVLPRMLSEAPVAVLVHGSEHYSAVDQYHRQHLYPAHGVGVFVYDKRGTGGSSGKYTQDFHILAADAAAALGEARRLAGRRASRIGFDGGSQAGWIAPLAALSIDAEFVAIGFGLAESPLAEDREQVKRDLIAAGYGPDVLAKALEVTEATGIIMGSGFKRGFDELDAARAKYAKEPWWGAMRGEFTGELAAHTGSALRAGGTTGGVGTTWDYEPMPTLRKLEVPLLWVLAGEDNEAPIEETRARLLTLAREGKPITLAVFPCTDHGILRFTTDANGRRTPLRYADGYFRMLVEWLGTFKLENAPYGTAEILASPQPANAD